MTVQRAERLVGATITGVEVIKGIKKSKQYAFLVTDTGLRIKVPIDHA